MMWKEGPLTGAAARPAAAANGPEAVTTAAFAALAISVAASFIFSTADGGPDAAGYSAARNFTVACGTISKMRIACGCSAWRPNHKPETITPSINAAPNAFGTIRRRFNQFTSGVSA